MYNYFKKAALLCGTCFISVQLFCQVLPDTEIKKNIRPLSGTLNSVLKLEPKTFEYNTEKFSQFKFNTGKQYGFLAENVVDAFPQLVKVKYYTFPVAKNSTQTVSVNIVDTQSLVPLLVASIQELHAEIEKLKAEVKTIKGVAVN